jgi:hypothetical protein
MLDLTGPDVAVLLIVITALCAFVVWHLWPRMERIGGPQATELGTLVDRCGGAFSKRLVERRWCLHRLSGGACQRRRSTASGDQGLR